MIKKLPDTLVIVLSILAVFVVLTWIIPAGEFDREIKNNREVVVPNSYKTAESNPQGFFALFKAPIKGFISAAEIIGFVFIVGGAFGIINRTGAINAGLANMVQFSLRHPSYKRAIIPLIMTLFSLAGATFGMSEEVMVFILITIPLAFALGYDSIVGVAMPFVGAGAGFAGAFSNPFTIGIAQGIAEIPIFSGWEYRLIVWLLFTLAAILFVMRYASKIEKAPKSSLVFEIDRLREKSQQQENNKQLTHAHRLVLLLFFIGLGLLIYGVNAWDWYIQEIAGLFFALGIGAAAISRISLDDIAEGFKEGAKEMMTAGLVIALSKGILIVASDGKIIDTVLFYISESAEGLPKAISVQVMFIMQSFLNFFLPSGSGQAALTMPIMAPLSDLLGISRQVAVLAFQFGDGLSNMVIPTSGVTMGILAIAKIPYEKWLKWMLPLFIILFILGMLLLLPPVLFFDWTA